MPAHASILKLKFDLTKAACEGLTEGQIERAQTMIAIATFERWGDLSHKVGSKPGVMPGKAFDLTKVLNCLQYLLF